MSIEKNNIKFSVIVPVYNVERYLRECLDSILMQTDSACEIICINDASTDTSNEILQLYQGQHSNIRVLQHDRNRGLSAARNTGIKAAQGEYIVFVDSDDMLAKNALAALNECIEDIAYDIVYYNMSVVNEGTFAKGNKVRVPQYTEYSGTMSGQELFVAFYKHGEIKIETWRQMYRKKFLEENQLWFYEGILHEDELFSVKAAIKAKTVKNINKDLYVYRRRDNSIMSTMSERRLDSLVVIVSEFLGICKCEQLDEEMRKILVDYASRKLYVIRKFITYYPKHKVLSIGSVEDQLFYSLILGENNNIYKYIDISEEQLEVLKKESKIVVYGIGNVGVEVIRFLQVHNIKISEVVVTQKEINISEVQGYSVKQLDELPTEYKDALIVLAVKNSEKQRDILSILEKNEYKRIMIPRFV